MAIGRKLANIFFSSIVVLFIATPGFGQTSTARFAYVANYGSDNISGYSIDPSSGALTPIPGSPFPAGAGPQSVVIDPTGRFAYVANAGAGITLVGSISAYTIDPNTGALAAVPGSPFTPVSGTEVTSLTMHPTGEFLYAELFAYEYGAVAAFTIDQTSGALTAVAGSPFAMGQEDSPVTLHPSGKFAYIRQLPQPPAGTSPTGVLLGFTIDSVTGVLTAVPGSPFSPASPTNSLWPITVHPTGKFEFMPNSADVSAFEINGTTGSLTPSPGSPFAAELPISVTIEPTGKFAYVVDNSCGAPGGSVTAFTIDSSTGALGEISTVAAGACPQSMKMHPSGLFAYVADQTGVLGYSINTVTGALSPLSGSPFPGGYVYPLSVDTSGIFAYTPNGSDAISAYTINLTTGTLTAVPGSPFAAGTSPLSVTLTAGPSVLVPSSLTVASTNPVSGVSVTASPADNNGISNGNTQFMLSYNNGAVVTLTAPATADGSNFSSWTGCDSTSGQTCTVTMSANRTVTANYAPPTGTITVTTNLAGATFTITGPTTFSGSGTSATFNNAPVGTYTIAFGAVSGYITPSSQTQTLTAGNTINFTGTYVLPPPQLVVSPTSLSFSYQTGTGAAVAPQSVSISSSNSALSPTLSTSTTPAGGIWLSSSLPVGPTPTSITVNVAPGLPPGTYSGQVAVSAAGASNSPLSIPVTLTVTAGPLAELVFPVRQDAHCLGGTCTPYTANIFTVFDHQMETAYETDQRKAANNKCVTKKIIPPTYGSIIDFQNEQASLLASTDGSGICDRLFGYTSANQSSFLSGLNYIKDPYLYYDSHPGYDYPFDFGTAVYPAVSGCVSYNLNAAGAPAAAYHVLTIIPLSAKPSAGCEKVVKGSTTYMTSETNYVVFYLHLASYPATNGNIVRCTSPPPTGSSTCPKKNQVVCPTCPKEGSWVSVSTSQPIAYVGTFSDNRWGNVGPHLHFEVDWEPTPGNTTPVPIDPYGWWSGAADPYTGLTTKVNTWLWK